MTTTSHRATDLRTLAARLAVLIALAALTACGAGADMEDDDDPDLDHSAAAIAVAGAWRLPSSTRSIGQSQYVPYVGAGPWIGTSGCSGTFNPAARALGDHLRRTFPSSVSSYGGYSCRPNTANTSMTSVHGTGRAIDVFIPTTAGQADNTRGDPVANWLVENAQRLGVQYIIWDRTDWNASRSGEKASPYGGPHPHHDHLHVELNPSARPIESCTAHCEPGDILVNSNCGRGDCNVYGARCVNDSHGARCVFGACPAVGVATICVDEQTMATCWNGAARISNCGAYAGLCSTAGRARTDAHCVSAFCVDSARDRPVAHNGCWIEGGRRLHCDSEGALTTSACPTGQACSMIGGPHCEARQCPATGTPEICVDDRYIANCHGGSIINSLDCGAFGHLCSTAGSREPRCVSVFCVANADERPVAHGVCLPDGRRASCTSAGALRNLTRCPSGESCVVEGDTARCRAPTPDAGIPPADGGPVPVVGDGGSIGDGGTTDIEPSPGDEDETPDSDAAVEVDASVESDAGIATGDASRTTSDARTREAGSFGVSEEPAGCACRAQRSTSSRSGRSTALFGMMAALCVLRRRAGSRRRAA